MAGIRDDSAGTYGQWTNPQDQSWLDYLGMKAADVGGGAYNALANITGWFKPYRHVRAGQHGVASAAYDHGPIR